MWVKSSVQATASLGVAGKATGGFEKIFFLIFLGSVPVFRIAVDGCCEILEGCSSFRTWKKSWNSTLKILNFMRSSGLGYCIKEVAEKRAAG